MSEQYFIGLDLGQAHDYSALVVLQSVGEEKAHHIRHIQRFKLGTPYPAIVDQTRRLMRTAPLTGAQLVVDNTGVGRPVVDLFRQAGLQPVAVTITGGDAVTNQENEYRVPKRDLVSSLQVLFQCGKLKIAEELPEAKTLIQELLNFKVAINLKTAHDSYEAWREGIHDDLVLAAALACWCCKHGPKKLKPYSISLGRGISTY